ncbi:unnamed protein product [Musa acuminata var. zebrina]
MESDPVKIAVDGVETFKKENRDLIFVDTRGQHKQEAFLNGRYINTDLIIFVMESSIGQATFDQAQAFKKSVAIGAVIIIFKYNLQGQQSDSDYCYLVCLQSCSHQKTSPFIGTGEHMDEFENFDVKPFVSPLQRKLYPAAYVPAVQKHFSKWVLQVRLTYGSEYLVFTRARYFCYVQLFSMLPWFSAKLMSEGHEKESQAKIKLFMTIMDSMTNAELDGTNPKLMNEYHTLHTARGSERSVRDVLPPQMLKQIGGMGGLQNFMKQMGLKDMGGLVGSSDEGTNRIILYII